MGVEQMDLSAIDVCEDSVREELGDIDKLAASMKAIGLLHPVVINSKNQLICGTRRLAAAEKLGWKRIDVRRVSSLDQAVSALVAERDENTCRENLTPLEQVELGRKLEELEWPDARKRQATSTGGRNPKLKPASGNLPEAANGETREKVGEAVGMSGVTYQRAKAVVEAAEENPEKFGHLKEELKKPRSVNRAYDELKSKKRKPRHDAGKALIGQHEWEGLFNRTVQIAEEWESKAGIKKLARTWEDEVRWSLCETLERLARQLSRLSVELTRAT